MIRGAFTLGTFLFVIFLPWPFAALLALAGAAYVPLLPLAAGIFADTLYWTSRVSVLPLFTLCGAVVALTAFLVRVRLKAGIIGK